MSASKRCSVAHHRIYVESPAQHHFFTAPLPPPQKEKPRKKESRSGSKVVPLLEHAREARERVGKGPLLVVPCAKQHTQLSSPESPSISPSQAKKEVVDLRATPLPSCSAGSGLSAHCWKASSEIRSQS